LPRSHVHRFPAENLEGEARALYDAMSDLIKVYQFRDRDRTHCHGISVTECYALEIVNRQGPLRLGELARRLHLEKSTTSRTVDALQRKGLVERRAHERDRRALQIDVTTAGRRLHERIAREVRQRYRKLLEDVPAEFRPVVIGFLERLAQSRIAAASEGCGDRPGLRPRRMR
jgi:MarR family 2-MHQ and catechol resistance regulon transcriptional repressor